MANLILTLPVTDELSVRRIAGGDWANAKDGHHLVGLGARALINFKEPSRNADAAGPKWPMAGRLVKATISGWTGATGDHGSFRGNNPRIRVRRNVQPFKEQSGGSSAENVWTQNAPNVTGVDTTATGAKEFNVPAAANKAFSVDVTDALGAVLPSRLQRQNGSDGGGAKWHGWTFLPLDDDAPNRACILWTRRGNADRKLVLTVEINVFAKPSSPDIVAVVGAVDGSADPIIVATPSGRSLEVQFGFRSEAPSDTCAKAKLDWHEPTADDETPGPVAFTTDWVVPTSLSSGDLQYSVRLTGLPFRREGRFRVTTQSQKGKAGDPSSLEDELAHVVLATVGLAPIDVRMQGYTSSPVIGATINSADPTDYVTAYQIEAYRRSDGVRVNAWPEASTVSVSGTSTRRVEFTWGGTQLRHNEDIEYRVRLTNRDGVPGAWSPWITQRVRDRVGPVLTPADGPIDTRTPTFTITDTLFDGWQLWLRTVDGTLIYTTGLATGSAVTSKAVAIPAGTLAFGQVFVATSATRPDGGSELGPESEGQTYTVTSLPATAISVPGWRRGLKVQTTDLPVLRTVTDADGDPIEAILMELRVAADPPGSGVLIESRLDEGIVPALASTGRTLDLLTSATGWVADANVTAGTGNQQPSGYTGNSLELVFASSAATRGATLVFDPPLDLSGFGGGALVRIHRRLTSNTNLSGIWLQLESADGEWAWPLAEAGATIDTWAEAVSLLGDPGYDGGDLDLSAVTAMRVYAIATGGAYAGTVHVRDLRIGTTRTNKSTPDGSLAFESSVDIRAAARDGATALASTTLSGSEAVGQTVIGVASSASMGSGQIVVIDGDVPEARTIASVDNGTQITVSEALDHAHDSSAAVTVYPFGAFSGWLTVPIAQPPSVALSSPADEATVTRPWPTLTWDTTAYGGRTIVSSRVHLELVTEDGTEPLLILDVVGSAETIAVPNLVLDTETEHSWWVEATDDAGMTGTSAVRTFTTSFTEPDPVLTLDAAAIPETSEVELTWQESDDPDLVGYEIEHRQRDGSWLRVDGGPETAGDGRTPYTATVFRHVGADLGANAYRVRVQNGWQASEPVTADATLGWPPDAPGLWIVARQGLVVPVDVTDARRSQPGMVETFEPPGGVPRHVSWGLVGERLTLDITRIPAMDGELTWLLRDLIGTAAWFKAPPGYAWRALWCTVLSVEDRPQGTGGIAHSMSIMTTGGPAHGYDPTAEDETEPDEELEADAVVDLDDYDFGEVEIA